MCPVCKTVKFVSYELDLFRAWLNEHPKVLKPVHATHAWVHFVYFTAIVVGFKEVYIVAAGLLAFSILLLAMAGEE